MRYLGILFFFMLNVSFLHLLRTEWVSGLSLERTFQVNQSGIVWSVFQEKSKSELAFKNLIGAFLNMTLL